MQRTTLTIAEKSYELAQGGRIEPLKSALEEAVRSGGKFVDVVVVGNVAVSILASPGIPILLTTREVSEDSRDNGNVDEPFNVTEWEISDLFR
jgi:hypothetical protein